MFSIIPANRACLTDPATISPTQFVFSFPSTPSFSHLVVFILPGNILPPETAAGVYLQLPGSGEIRFLGAIGNEKPSAIFKVNLLAPNQGPDAGQSMDADAMTDDNSFATPAANSFPLPSTLSGTQGRTTSGNINLGISVEPITNIQAQLATLQPPSRAPNAPSRFTAAVSAPDAIVVHRPAPEAKILAQRIIKDAFNFLASFAGSAPGGQEVVPLKSFQDWWIKFERRLDNDPLFLEKGDG